MEIPYLKYSIYLLRNPLTNQVFYIGKTRLPIQDRFEQHLVESKAESDKPYARKNLTKNSVIREIISAGKEPIMEVIETVKVFTVWDSTNCSLKELMWMEHYKSLNEPLVNIFGVKRKHRLTLKEEWKHRQCHILSDLIYWGRKDSYFIEKQYVGKYCLPPETITTQIKTKL